MPTEFDQVVEPLRIEFDAAAQSLAWAATFGVELSAWGGGGNNPASGDVGRARAAPGQDAAIGIAISASTEFEHQVRGRAAQRGGRAARANDRRGGRRSGRRGIRLDYRPLSMPINIIFILRRHYLSRQ